MSTHTPPPPGEGQGPVDPRGALRPPQGSPVQQQTPQGPPAGPPPMMPPPPMYYPPPPPMYYPPPPQKSGGAGRAILLTLLGLAFFVGLIVIGLFVLVGGLASAGGGDANAVVRRTVDAGERDQTVAVIPVAGLIVDETQQRFQRDLDAAAADPNVRALVVTVSSPGGTVTDSNQMYHALLAFKSERNVPVVVHMDDVAASGGYFLACAADEIYAEETTITGSIGVLIQFPQLSEFAEKTGIRLKTIVADGSPKKDFLDTFTETDEEDMVAVRELLNDQYDLFRSVVQAGRGSQIAAAGASIDEAASGAVFLGPRAKQLGLVDHIGFLGDAVAGAASLAGLADPNVVRYDRPPTLAETLGLAVESPRFDAASMKSLAVELMHEATAPRSLYLYAGPR